MIDAVSLTSEDRERLLFLIDTSIKINKRFQFFLWAQGTLQSFIPHETLVCAVGDLHALQLRNDVFSRAMLPEDFDAVVKDPVHGLMPPLVTLWVASEREPVVLEAERPAHPVLRRLGYRHGLCHGVREMRGEQGAFFAFLGLEKAPGARERYFADLLMPHLYMALVRMLESEVAPTDGAVALLSEREIQVLGWVRDGKTNAEIGQILEISPLTVKNHVQKILRKLDVANRAQAVAKGVSIGLLGSGPMREVSGNQA